MDGLTTRINIESSIKGVESRFKGEFVVTDSNVEREYGELLKGARTHILPCGENAKSIGHVEKLLSAMQENGLKRGDKIIAFGGGTVGDTAGFAAAIYYRGIAWECVPTTFLAMADSCIGGKTALNLNGTKNAVGAFHRPAAVDIRTDFIKTLPERELRSGLGEAFKTSLLDEKVNAAYSEYITGGDVTKLVKALVKFKERVTEADFFDRNERRILNIGHTAGHALESADDFFLSHGEYVAFGLAAESFLLSRTAGFSESVAKQIESGARAIADFDRIKKIDMGRVTDFARADKKNADGKITVIACENYRTKEIAVDEKTFERVLNEWKSSL